MKENSADGNQNNTTCKKPASSIFVAYVMLLLSGLIGGLSMLALILLSSSYSAPFAMEGAIFGFW